MARDRRKPDPCLGKIPGARGACCGHGQPAEEDGLPYILLDLDESHRRPGEYGKPVLMIEFPVDMDPAIMRSVGTAVSIALALAPTAKT